MQQRPIAIVTGAGSRGAGVGNGRAIAAVLAREGFDLVLVDRSADALDATIELVADHGEAEVHPVVGDVADLATCDDIVATANGAGGPLRAVVNNVGVFGPEDGIAGADVDTWGPAWHVNVTSMALLARFAIPSMTRTGGGAIVNLASVAALAGTGTDSLFYSASKGAIVALTRQLASRHGPDGVRVNCVAPGMVETPMVEGRSSDESRIRRRMACPMRREGTAWDVAEAVGFLVSERARWISGVVLPVDGGLMAVVPSTEGPWPGEPIRA